MIGNGQPLILTEAEGECRMEKAIRLLVTAGALMLVAGAIFGFLTQWILAALIWVGAFGCLMAALNFKNVTDNK